MTSLVRSDAAPGRSALRRLAAAAALVAGTVLAPREAFAGDPVRLQVELPPDVVSLSAAEVVDVQVIPIDAAGERVRPGGRTIEISASAGVFAVVKRPYSYQFTAPEKAAETTDVRLRAWFKEAPDISGETTVRVVPPAPFRRLVIDGPGTTAPGTGADLRVQGEGADGALKDLTDTLAEVKVEGPGSVSFLREGWLRYEAPADGKGTAKVRIALRGHPDVAATHAVLIAGSAGGGEAEPPKDAPKEEAAAPKEPPPPPPPAPAPSTGEKGATPEKSDAPEPPAKVEKGDKGEKDEGVVWPSGNLRVASWRTKGAGDEDYADAKTLPKPGGDFVAAKESDRLRVVVLREDVTKVELEEHVGAKDADKAKRIEPSKDGRFRLDRNKKGLFVVVWEGSPPENGKPLTVTLLLTTGDDKVLREELILRREAPSKSK